MSNRDQDILLLNTNPQKMVLKYKPVVEALVVKNLVKPGYFQYRDKGDLTQEVITGLLRDMGKIRESYNGHSPFRPFFVKIISNRCNGLRRKEFKQETKDVANISPDSIVFEKKKLYSKKYDYVQIDQEQLYGNNETDRDAIIESELEYLDVVFRMFALQKPKLIICLKVLSGRKVIIDELKYYNNNCKGNIYDKFIEFSNEARDKTNEERYKILTMFFNNCDTTNKGKDTIRKWISKILGEIVVQMNHVSIPPVYNKQNIMGLIGLYFDKKC